MSSLHNSGSQTNTVYDGTWIPIVSSGGADWTTTVQRGNFWVRFATTFFSLRIEYGAQVFTAGEVQITLPFLPDFTGDIEYSFVVGSMDGLNFTAPAINQITCHSGEGQFIHLSGLRSNGTELPITDSSFSAAGGIINISGTFRNARGF